MQSPAPGPITFEDLTWIPVVRQGWDHHTAAIHAYILYDRISDFKDGQTCEDGFLVDWNVKEHIQGERRREHVLFHSLNMFGMNVHMAQRIIGMIQIIPIQKNVDALLNFPSSNCNFIQMW